MFLGTYEHLRRGGFLELPHRTTLNKYTGFTEARTGFNPDVIKRFADEIKVGELAEHDRNISILFDEMRING